MQTFTKLLGERQEASGVLCVRERVTLREAVCFGATMGASDLLDGLLCLLGVMEKENFVFRVRKLIIHSYNLHSFSCKQSGVLTSRSACRISPGVPEKRVQGMFNLLTNCWSLYCLHLFSENKDTALLVTK